VTSDPKAELHLLREMIDGTVEPDRQRAGLGRYLLGWGEDRLSAAGHADFELHTRVENLPALAFYAATGWAVTDRLVRTVEHGIAYDEHVLIKHRH
jgi:ribosomal protein S18 acetylase RimI-like enzyme